MAQKVVEIPLVGGPGNGRTVRAELTHDGRPPATHPYGHGLTGTATYELVEADGGWQYAFRPSPNDNADFAPEHRSVTFSDQMPGGPERRPEDDSPRGLAGAD